MDSYLTLIAKSPTALRLPKINHKNDLIHTMGYGIFSSIDDISAEAPLYSLFSFNENHVKKASNTLFFAVFSGEHCLSFNLLPFRFYSTDGHRAGKEARDFIKHIGLNLTDNTYAVFDEIKDDQTCETFVYVHAAVCGSLLVPSKTLCDELYNLGSDLKRLYPTIDEDIYSLRTMVQRRALTDCRRGDWPLEGIGFDDIPQSSALKALVLEATRKRTGT